MAFENPRIPASIIALAAAVGAAGTSTAQPLYWTLSDNGNRDGIIDTSLGEFATLSIWAHCTVPAVGFAESHYSIAGDANWQTNGAITGYFHNPNLGPKVGTLSSDNSITGIESYQLPPFYNSGFDYSNPIALYVVDWMPTVAGSYSVTATSTHTLHQWYSDDFGDTIDLSIPSITFKVIPAPSSLALLCLSAASIGFPRRRSVHRR